jgi:hypothetical protein
VNNGPKRPQDKSPRERAKPVSFAPGLHDLRRAAEPIRDLEGVPFWEQTEARLKALDQAEALPGEPSEAAPSEEEIADLVRKMQDLEQQTGESCVQTLLNVLVPGSHHVADDMHAALGQLELPSEKLTALALLLAKLEGEGKLAPPESELWTGIGAQLVQDVILINPRTPISAVYAALKGALLLATDRQEGREATEQEVGNFLDKMTGGIGGETELPGEH